MVETLNRRRIRYGIYFGSYMFIATGRRVLSDIDVLVADEDIPKIKKLFFSCERVERQRCLYLYPGTEKKIEIVSRSVIHIGGAQYRFKLTDLAWRHTREIQVYGCWVRLCNPVDTILFKAILQRNEAQGKYDFSDIEALLEGDAIDAQYLEQRIEESSFNECPGRVLWRYRLSTALACRV